MGGGGGGGCASWAPLFNFATTMPPVWWDGLSSETSWLLLVGGFLTFVWLVRSMTFRKGTPFPPGPMPLPIIGHLHLLMGLPHEALAKASTKYGHIVGLKLGMKKCVVVSSPQLAKEFLTSHDKIFANRPSYAFVSSLSYGYASDLFFCGYGAPFRRRRKLLAIELFTEKRLRELEYVRSEEIAALLRRISDFSRNGTAPVDIGKSVGEMSTQIIRRLIFSRQEAPKQGGGVDLLQLIKETEHLTVPTIGDFVPWLSWLDRSRRPLWRDAHARCDAVITAMINERREAMLQNKAPQDDFLHTLLTKEMNDSSCDQDVLTTDEVKSIIHGVIGGGIHTTGLALEWTMAEILKNPHCLVKLQREIDTVTGMKEQIYDSDIPNLTYLRCVVKEVFRLHPLAPLLIPRVSSQECRVGKYILPAETQLLVNVWAIGRDEQVWHSAEQFIPERFEGNDTDVKGQHFQLLPFGGGRRICPGLPIALPVVQVTLANLLKRFDWELPPGITPSTMDMNVKRGIAMNKATPTIAIPKLRV